MTETIKKNALDSVTSHFRSKITGKMKSVKVPEWDLEIWFKESNTLKEEGRMLELAQQGKTIEALVETLITKARHEDGTKMFKPVDRTVLLNEADPQVVIRVVGEINNANMETTQEYVSKN